jgi:hypothetical protein
VDETLTSAEDYVVDYGLLLEDVALYQSLPHGSGAALGDGSDHAPDHGATSTTITPPFPRSDMVLGQTELPDGCARMPSPLAMSLAARLWPLPAACYCPAAS